MTTLTGEPVPHRATADSGPQLRRMGDMLQVSFRGRNAHVRDTKGMHDLAALLARPV